MHKLFTFLVLSLISINLASQIIQIQNTTSISTDSLQQFSNNSEPVKKLIKSALLLATKKLGYLYGSSEPQQGGMDCSGTIYYLLTQLGIKEVPRSSDLIYQWVLEKGHFYPVESGEFSSEQFSHLRPGDLLFWSGTYELKRSNDVTHVMIYLGTTTDGSPLIFGSSNGRTYQGKKVYGVSVFDFQLPNDLNKSKFLGYSCIPSYSCPDQP